jgi:uncharacterized protein YycO
VKYKLYSKKHVESHEVELQPGNFIVSSSDSFFDKMTHIVTLSRWNHAGLVVAADGTIIELETTGIQKSNISEYSKKDYYVVDVDMSKEDQKQVVSYAEYMLKKHPKYGYMTIISIIFKILTHSRLVIKLDGTLICSEFVAKALAEGGVIWDKDTSLITPVDLYRKFVK